ncbi:ethanolamine ammonia-lyase subunit EutC [Dechloromonas sp. XY25]|uniref:Ethanolamine ammonia-lyase small subunit n=1 Tax=Dechloromonas hankyongensis TaxID=2908002 RepID=A0ABS9K2D4_9RHOO|nr:ethanolamine ammonia-lyase subunit EutC [Dechloromonas hankyongensis]MCG2577239.1 ethanolamine ammonia-lyase subunit EutC [Dechloromonas hankyongensis]
MGKLTTSDNWQALRVLTPARIALGRAGCALPTGEVLRFGLAHAQARDAVHLPLDIARLEAELTAAGFASRRVHSAAPDRRTYLLRPDLGRQLRADDRETLLAAASSPADVCFVIADGLSAQAVQSHAVPLLQAFHARSAGRWTTPPVVIAEQGRVALGDEVGECLRARLVVVLIGERPGLSSPDSLGVYLTYGPQRGRTDGERNCISNVRPEGLPCDAAAARLVWLVEAALQRGTTGVALKDESEMAAIADAAAPAAGQQTEE